MPEQKRLLSVLAAGALVDGLNVNVVLDGLAVITDVPVDRVRTEALGAFVEKHPRVQRPQAFVYDLSAEAVKFAGMGKPAGYDEALFELLVAAEHVATALFVGQQKGGPVSVKEAQRLIDALHDFRGLDEALQKAVHEKIMAEFEEFAKSVEREKKEAGKC